MNILEYAVNESEHYINISHTTVFPTISLQQDIKYTSTKISLNQVIHKNIYRKERKCSQAIRFKVLNFNTLLLLNNSCIQVCDYTQRHSSTKCDVETCYFIRVPDHINHGNEGMDLSSMMESSGILKKHVQKLHVIFLKENINKKKQQKKYIRQFRVLHYRSGNLNTMQALLKKINPD